MTKKIWGIVNKKTIKVSSGEDTTYGSYVVDTFGKPARKFHTRNEAREFKRTIPNTNRYAIVNTAVGYVSR